MTEPEPTAATVWNPAGTVRAGEQLPAKPLSAYLDQLFGRSEPITIEQFRGGHSNLTYLIRFGGDELVLRRPPFGSTVATAHDMSREYRVLSALAPHYNKAPRVFGYCDDLSVIGAPFYLMERVRGLIIRRNVPQQIEFNEQTASSLSKTLIDTLAELHQLDYLAIGLADLGKPIGYVERQVRGWTQRYDSSKTSELVEATTVAEWLASNQPTDNHRAALIHNDFKFDNLVLDPNGLRFVNGILDWEMSTIGDPWMDLGTSLCYWVQDSDPDELKAIAFGPTTRPGMWTRQQLLERYAQISGTSVENPTFFYIFGLFKLAAVVQQIYFRYVNGHTRDPRFAKLGHVATVLLRHAHTNID